MRHSFFPFAMPSAAMTLIAALAAAVAPNNVLAASQGTLGSTSTGSFTIRLVIPPRLEVTAQPLSTDKTSTPFCINGRGIDYYSTSLLPIRGSLQSGTPAPKHSTHTSCQNQLLVPTTRSAKAPYPPTVLIAPE